MRKKLVGRRPKSMMKVAFDGGSLPQLGNYHPTGVATITQGLIEELIRIEKRNNLFIYTFGSAQLNIPPKGTARIKWRRLPRQGFFSIGLPFYLNRDKPDVFLALSQAMPKASIPTIGFVYDVGFLERPQDYTDAERLTTLTNDLVQRAVHIVTISKASLQSITTHLHIPEDKLSYCHPGPRPLFKDVGPKYVGELPYFLFVGSLKRSKNVPLLLEGFFHYLKKGNPPHQLVLIGSQKQLDPEIRPTIKRFSLEKYVLIKDYVPTEELPKYYRGAKAFVSLSHLEGFGLPVIEAMACGTPVIVGHNSSMPEIVGKAGLFASTTSPDEVANYFSRFALDESVRQTQSRRVLKQVRLFNNRDFARKIRSIIDREVRN